MQEVKLCDENLPYALAFLMEWSRFPGACGAGT